LILTPKKGLPIHALVAAEEGSLVLDQVTKLPGLSLILHDLLPEQLAPLLKQAVTAVSATHVVSSASAVSKGFASLF
jgi:hypothetical protein